MKGLGCRGLSFPSKYGLYRYDFGLDSDYSGLRSEYRFYPIRVVSTVNNKGIKSGFNVDFKDG